MDKVLEIIGSIPLFNGLSEQQLGEIRGIARDRFYDKGKEIFAEGDEGGGFYIVASGQVKVFKLSPEGKEHILHIYGPGHSFGEVPVFSGERFPASAETLLKSHLLFFPRTDFVALLSGNPSLCMNLLADLSLRLRQFTIQIENLTLKEVPGRLASYLLTLSDEEGQGNSLSLNISKGQLAGLLGTIPETLSRIFLKMNNAGLIEVKGKEITILDRNGLQALAETGKFGG
ncbi:Crp/Fnr family transcriptional regulator [Syntrophus aciditrophicus]|uniref:Cyclic nucleotide-binding domain protein n=1 Tax=Syntrophus aciditrophicus (strain SB) TaxID=56780 RepID=Q2LPZ1_SYNAS|nr:Crp/Fnr family transcriptional regulator [Syntrophus aciditrophicus]ABC76342.1 cyclic nucleotide-binding domain protein [Syntrophus aciditrophicus SB]